jgi:hypothetical protein
VVGVEVHIGFHIGSEWFIIPREFHWKGCVATATASGKIKGKLVHNMVHPQTHAKFVIRLKALGSRFNPINGCQ